VTGNDQATITDGHLEGSRNQLSLLMATTSHASGRVDAPGVIEGRVGIMPTHLQCSGPQSLKSVIKTWVLPAIMINFIHYSDERR